MAFEYPSKRAARKLQSSVDRDGYIVGDAIIDWGNQHLYRRGTVIVVYLGQRPLVIRTLEDLLGPQFAPR